MTTNIEISDMIEKLHVPNFRGVIMRDEFKKLGKPWETEYGIYNLEESSENGSHWIMWAHQKNNWYHFCSYGSDPCKEFIEYIDAPVMSSTFLVQDFDEAICGELCVLVIYLLSEGIEFEDAVLSLVQASDT
jgi:hypothetical protein